ncbi:MAG: DUF4296 domain-containing protein [Saonia sp.]
MINRVLAIIILGILFSCGEKVLEKPDNLIPRPQMVAILYDLAIINSAKSTNVAILEENEIETMDYLYNKYNIDSLQFVKSDTYYASMPALYEEIYKDIETRLKKGEKKIEEDRKELNDSLRTKTVVPAKKDRPKDSLP